MVDARSATKPEDLFPSLGHGSESSKGGRAARHNPTVCRGIFAIKVILLLSILVCHFLSRQHTAHKLFGQSSNYSECYGVSLALLAGKGFRDLTWPESADRPEVKPIIEFLNLQRPKISPEQFAAFLHNRHLGTLPAHSFQRSRVLDIYLTALVWKVFGISWPVYYVFSSLASTASCLFIFLIARKLSGSYWAGVCASILFLASAFENHYGVRSLRDISPLWFGTMAFAFFICVVDYFRSSKCNYLWFFVLGILAVVGRGWRVDVLLLIPFLLVGLVIYLAWRRCSWIQVLLGSGLFLGGAWTCDRLICALCPGEAPGSGIVFHIALYGDSSRCNLMGLENSFQIPRDDIQTVFNSCCYNEGKNPDYPLAIHNRNEYQGLCLDFYNKDYGLVCQDMFIGSLKYHLYQYLRSWPEFYFQALASFPKRLGQYLLYLYLLGILTLFLIGADKIRGGLLALFSLYYSVAWFAVLPEQKHLGQLLLPLTVMGGLGIWGLARACRFLFLPSFPLGVTGSGDTATTQGKDKTTNIEQGTSNDKGKDIATFSNFEIRYSLFDIRHSLFGSAATRPVFLPRSFRLACGVALAAIVCWGLACALAYPYSLRHRQNLLNDIRVLALQGQDAPATIKDRRVFSKFLDPAATSAGASGRTSYNADKIGYVLTIQAASNPGYLTCRHVHFPSTRFPGRIFTTRHKLYPNRVQYFAVSCFHAARYGDNRPYACTVTLNPGASIIASKRLDLSTWKRLPFSTVYCDDETASAGSPVVGRFPPNDSPSDPSGLNFSFNDLSTEVAYGYPWETLSLLGLPSEQNFEYPGLKPVRLSARFVDFSAIRTVSAGSGDRAGGSPDRVIIGELHSPADFDEANQSGLPLSHWIPQSGVTFSANPEGTAWHVTAEQSGTLARYSPLSVSEDGIYLFKLKYRPGAGDLSLQALPVNGEASLNQSCRTTQEGDDAVLSLEAKLKAGEPFQLRLASRPLADSRACRFTLKKIHAYREKHPSWELSQNP